MEDNVEGDSPKTSLEQSVKKPSLEGGGSRIGAQKLTVLGMWYLCDTLQRRGAKEAVQELLLGPDIDGSSNVACIIFVGKSAVNHHKLMLSLQSCQLTLEVQHTHTTQ